MDLFSSFSINVHAILNMSFMSACVYILGLGYCCGWVTVEVAVRIRVNVWGYGYCWG